MFLVVLAILLVIGATLWYLYGRRATPARRPHTPASATPHRPGGIDKLKGNRMFWGAELAETGCEAARALQGRQYPFEDVPELPLPDCDSAACTCQFRGLPDKRSQTRRTHPDRREEIRFDADKSDRRARVSRRRADKWNDHTL
jgi:hypothetical protein